MILHAKDNAVSLVRYAGGGGGRVLSLGLQGREDSYDDALPGEWAAAGGHGDDDRLKSGVRGTFLP